MSVAFGLHRAALLGGIGLAALALGSTASGAQSLYCQGGGFGLDDGFCTNGVIGAFSNAALAAQALSDVSQSASLEATQTALSAISARRRVEQEGCPPGQEVVNGECRPAVVTPVPGPAAAPRRAAPRARPAAAPAPVYPAFVETATRYGTWIRLMGDYERRTGNATVTGGIIGGPIAGATFTIDSSSRATSWGFVAGADLTTRGVAAPGDGLILGILVGYVDSEVRLTATSSTAGLSDGSGALNAHLYGPTLGAYLTYFNGGFSADLTFKADLLKMSVSFTDLLAFNDGTTAQFAGSGSTDLVNYTTIGNLNYRIPLAGAMWVEPTVGFMFSAAKYSSGAARLGLADGEVFRVQGGARFGTEWMMDRVRVTPVLTALIYDNVKVSGGFVTTGGFLNTPVGLADEGKIRGQGILAFNFDFGNGLTSFVQGEVRGGENLIGYGGKGGFRYQW